MTLAPSEREPLAVTVGLELWRRRAEADTLS